VGVGGVCRGEMCRILWGRHAGDFFRLVRQLCLCVVEEVNTQSVICEHTLTDNTHTQFTHTG